MGGDYLKRGRRDRGLDQRGPTWNYCYTSQLCKFCGHTLHGHFHVCRHLALSLLIGAISRVTSRFRASRLTSGVNQPLAPSLDLTSLVGSFPNKESQNLFFPIAVQPERDG